MAKTKSIIDMVRGWAKNTTVDSKKIAKYFGVNHSVVETICKQERPWVVDESL